MNASDDVAPVVPARTAAPDFDSVFRQNYAGVARAVERVIGDHGRAEDIAIEAFWKLWHRPNKALGRTFEANPALVLHFPETAPVRDLVLGDGGRGIFLGEPDGRDGGICFFWTSGDRVFIVSADHLSHARAIQLADSTR